MSSPMASATTEQTNFWVNRLEFKAEFEIEKETKNTIRYKEISVPPRVGTIYIQKWVCGTQPPKKIKVHVQSIESVATNVPV